MPLGNKWLSLVAYVSMAGGIVSLLVIPRLYAVTNGRVMIHGHDVRDVTLHSLRGNVGIVLQDSFAFASSISDNIGYGLDNPPIEDVIAAAKVAQFHDFVSRLPDGYDTCIGERVIHQGSSNHGGGQCQASGEPDGSQCGPEPASGAIKRGKVRRGEQGD